MSKFGGGYDGKESIFDGVSNDDIVIAFFPCVRFETKIELGFRGQMTQQKNWTDTQKLEYSMKLHEELHELYTLICKLVVIAIRKGFKLVIENPYTQPHYLTRYWCLKPSLVDKNRRRNGDYYSKPTQYWFVNCEPKKNFIFEPIEHVQAVTIDAPTLDSVNRTVARSMIHPQYANRFIRQHIL